MTEEQVSCNYSYLQTESYIDIFVKVIHSRCLYLYTLQPFSLQLQSSLNRVVDLPFHEDKERAGASTSVGTKALEPVREPVDGGREIRPWVWFKLLAEVDAATADYWEVELETGVES